MSTGTRAPRTRSGGGGPGGFGFGGGASSVPKGPAPSSKNAKPLPRILGQLRPYRGRSILILVLIVVASLLGVGASVLLEPMINDGLFPANGTGSEEPNVRLVLGIGAL